MNRTKLWLGVGAFALTQATAMTIDANGPSVSLGTNSAMAQGRGEGGEGGPPAVEIGPGEGGPVLRIGPGGVRRERGEGEEREYREERQDRGERGERG